ncbi:MAG TPA: polysaccharide deacetylase family protein [Chitinophagaceae bacterium]
MKVILYSPQISPRLNYIIDFLSVHIFGEPVILTTDIAEFKNTDAIKLNYSLAEVDENEIRISPHALLFEEGIQPQLIECFEWHRLKVFFKTEGNIPFDIFAASFYLLTRYEEYLPYEQDEYERYAHVNSLAFKENFLHLPLVNLWIEELIKLIQRNRAFRLQPLTFKFAPTYDIDIAYRYLHHSVFRNLGGYYKEILSGKWKLLKERDNVFSGSQKDPFDTYDWLASLNNQYNLEPVYFFLLAQKRKGYDKNISPHNRAMQKLIQWHAARYTVGIHPSWQSGDDKIMLLREISLLEKISGKKITHSRQHYIRMNFPETYRRLINEGIKHDYSMGYGSINGFRASVTLPFYWYDLEKEEKTSLLIYPFCYMEANSYFEQHYSAEKAAQELQGYYDIVRSVKGQLITIFHNHFLTEQQQWLSWRKMYHDFLQRNFVG